MARFALMHSLATSLFFWFSMILRETVDSLHHQMVHDGLALNENDSSREIMRREAMPLLMNLTGDAGISLNFQHFTQ